jgi:hypothetical protein
VTIGLIDLEDDRLQDVEVMEMGTDIFWCILNGFLSRPEGAVGIIWVYIGIIKSLIKSLILTC